MLDTVRLSEDKHKSKSPSNNSSVNMGYLSNGQELIHLMEASRPMISAVNYKATFTPL